MIKKSIVVLSTAVALTTMAAQVHAESGVDPTGPNFHGVAIRTPHPRHTFLGIVIRPSPRPLPSFHGIVIRPHPGRTPFRQGTPIQRENEQ